MYKIFKKETLQALVVTPLMVATLSFGSFDTTHLPSVISFNTEKQNTEEVAVLTEKANILQKQADLIDSYFKDHNMRLAGFGMKMAKVADNNGLDYRLIPAIAVRESTGGNNMCRLKKNNPFGWGSCKIGFKTMDEAIEIIGHNLGGNNPNTTSYYDEKDVEGILKAYNPPKIVPAYARQVMKIMENIGDENIT